MIITYSWNPDTLELGATAALSNGQTYGKGFRFTTTPTEKDIEKHKMSLAMSFDVRELLIREGFAQAKAAAAEARRLSFAPHPTTEAY